MVLKDLQYLISSYLLLEEILGIFCYTEVDLIVKFYNIKLPTIDNACYKGEIYTVKYLYIKGYLPHPNAIYWASANKDLKMMKYLIEVVGIIPSEEVLNSACSDGHCRIVKYLIEVLKIKPSINTLNSAIKNGSLDIVKYLVEVANTEPTQSTIKCAFRYKYLEIVKYFAMKGFEFTRETIEYITKHADLELVHYLNAVANIK